MTISYGACTHVGMKRDHNEDAYLVFPEERLFAVADGMGGHASGEVASRIACDELRQFFEMTGKDRDATWPFKLERARSYDENRISVAVRVANQAVFDRSASDARCRGMGTTIVAGHFTEDARLIVGHAGDSRAYRFREGQLSRLTVDHSLVEEYIRLGRLTEEEAKNFPQKNIILRALGQQRSVDVELAALETRPGDVYLLCSDGLSGMLEDEQTAAILAETAGDLDRCARELVAAANDNGGLDNVTCVLARVEA